MPVSRSISFWIARMRATASGPALGELLLEHLHVEADAREGIAHLVGDVGRHATDGSETLGLDEALLGAQLLGDVLGHDEHRARGAVAAGGAEGRDQDIDGAVVEGHRVDHRALGAARHVVHGLAEGRETRGQGERVEGAADVARAEVEHAQGGRVHVADHALPVDDDHGRTQTGDDLGLHALEAAARLARFSQTRVASGEGFHHAFELARQPAEVIVAARLEAKRQVAAGDGLHALVQERQGLEHALRPPCDRHSDAEGEQGEEAEQESGIPLLVGGAAARRGDAVLQARPGLAEVTLDGALLGAQVGEDRGGALGVAGVDGLKQLRVLRVRVPIGGGDPLEVAAHLQDRDLVGGAWVQTLGELDLVQGAVERGGANAARGVDPALGRGGVRLAEEAVEQRAEDRLGGLGLTDGEGEGQVALVEEAQGACGALVLHEARDGDGAERGQDEREPEEDARRDREARTPAGLGFTGHRVSNRSRCGAGGRADGGNAGGGGGFARRPNGRHAPPSGLPSACPARAARRGAVLAPGVDTRAKPSAGHGSHPSKARGRPLHRRRLQLGVRQTWIRARSKPPAPLVHSWRLRSVSPPEQRQQHPADRRDQYQGGRRGERQRSVRDRAHAQ